uniref:Uncharacterized protein n=1 Tax=Zooxanthella nutricula TaxID=1333877 RepID=A0A7S2KZR9_9DINO
MRALLEDEQRYAARRADARMRDAVSGPSRPTKRLFEDTSARLMGRACQLSEEDVQLLPGCAQQLHPSSKFGSFTVAQWECVCQKCKDWPIAPFVGALELGGSLDQRAQGSYRDVLTSGCGSQPLLQCFVREGDCSSHTAVLAENLTLYDDTRWMVKNGSLDVTAMPGTCECRDACPVIGGIFKHREAQQSAIAEFSRAGNDLNKAELALNKYGSALAREVFALCDLRAQGPMTVLCANRGYCPTLGAAARFTSANRLAAWDSECVCDACGGAGDDGQNAYADVMTVIDFVNANAGAAAGGTAAAVAADVLRKLCWRIDFVECVLSKQGACVHVADKLNVSSHIARSHNGTPAETAEALRNRCGSLKLSARTSGERAPGTRGALLGRVVALSAVGLLASL